MRTREHWNDIFASTRDERLGWYEPDVSQTLAFLQGIPHHDGFTTFLPGAGTSLLVDALLARRHKLVLNDVSDAALARLRARIGAPQGVVWLHHDIALPLPGDTPQADLWVDRAVLHFLRDEADIAGYFANLHAAVKPGGWVLLAQFAADGAPRCAGLDVHRYSLEELTRRLGADYTLERQASSTFTNPRGEPRPYVYALYRRAR